MRNKNVGFLIIGISVLIAVIILIFNVGMTSIVNTTCSHGPSCSMYATIKTQTYISFAIASFVLIIGLFLVFSKENERIIIRKIRPEAKAEPKKFSKESLKDLNEEEAKIMSLLIENRGTLFQSEIVDITGLNKVRITRILDSLEAQDLIERKRRGMTNIVVIKTK